MPRPFPALVLAGLLLSTGLTPWLRAEEVSPEVQALYAKAQAAQARNDNDTAVASYRRILKLAPELSPAYNNLGRLLFNLGRYSESIDVLQKGLALAPEMHPAQVMLGASYLQLGRYDEAVAPLSAGVAAMPEDRFARISLARALIGVNKSEDALVQLNSILATSPKDQEAWYLVGKLHLQLSQQAFATVQTLDPNAPLAHELEGEVMESLGNTAGAVAAYKQAIAAARGEPGPQQHLADLYWRTGDWAHAREQYTVLLEREPGNCAAHWRLAESLDQLSEPPEAGLREINEALAQCPSLAQARAERARLLLRLNRPKEALPDLEAAEKAAPDEPTVQQLLTRAYRAMGDRERADAANKRYLELQQAIHAAEERHASAVIQANQ